MRVATVALLFAGSAIQHCTAGSQKALRAAVPPSTHEVLLQDSLGSQIVAGLHGEHHLEAHMHKHAAKISLMTIASERGPSTAHHGGPHRDTTDDKEGRSHIEEAHLSKVERDDAQSSHKQHRHALHKDSGSHSAASEGKTSADVADHVGAKHTVKATDESQVASRTKSSLGSGASTAGAVAHAGAEGKSSNVGAAEDREVSAIYHTIAKNHAEDTSETSGVADTLDSSESDDETEASSDSTKVAVSKAATTSDDEEASEEAADSEEVVDSDDDADSEGAAAETAAESEAPADSVAEDTSEDAADSEDTEESEETASDEADSEGADDEVTTKSEVVSKSEGRADVDDGSDSEISVDTGVSSRAEIVARGGSSADATTVKNVAGDDEAQPASDSDGLPGQVSGQDGEVMPEPAPSEEGEGARSEPGSDSGSLNIGDSEMQAEAVGPADSYHDGSTESEDWGKEYGAAAQAFQQKVEAGESESAEPSQGMAGPGGGGSGSMALVVGLIIILGLTACALGLGTKI